MFAPQKSNLTNRISKPYEKNTNFCPSIIITF